MTRHRSIDLGPVKSRREQRRASRPVNWPLVFWLSLVAVALVAIAYQSNWSN